MTTLFSLILYLTLIFSSAPNAYPSIYKTMLNSKFEKNLTGIPFPEIKTISLAGDTVLIPNDTRGKPTLLCFAFVQNAQWLVDTWTLPVLEQYPSDEINYYEIPMLAGGYKFVRGFIDGGMKRGVPSHLHRHVATYYGPMEKYKSELQMSDNKTIYLFLLDAEGVIIHTDEGTATDEKLRKLYSMIGL